MSAAMWCGSSKLKCLKPFLSPSLMAKGWKLIYGFFTLRLPCISPMIVSWVLSKCLFRFAKYRFLFLYPWCDDACVCYFYAYWKVWETRGNFLGVIQMMQSGHVLFYKIGVPEKPMDRFLNLTCFLLVTIVLFLLQKDKKWAWKQTLCIVLQEIILDALFKLVWNWKTHAWVKEHIVAPRYERNAHVKKHSIHFLSTMK